MRWSLGVLAAAGVAVLVVRWAPAWLADPSNLEPGSQTAAERGRVRTALVTLLAGALAAVGAVYTVKTFALNRRGQATERFTRAVDQLGSDKLDVRLGGVYALEQLARDSDREHGPVMEVLTAYVRRRAAVRTTNGRPVPVDVQAVLTVLARRNRSHERGRTLAFDLSETNLHGVQAEGAPLRGARLTKANLQDAALLRADLRDAGLIETRLDRAILRHADLRGAKLRQARLFGANLADTKLEGAELAGALYDEFTIWPAGFDAEQACASPNGFG